MGPSLASSGFARRKTAVRMTAVLFTYSNSGFRSGGKDLRSSCEMGARFEPTPIRQGTECCLPKLRMWALCCVPAVNQQLSEL